MLAANITNQIAQNNLGQNIKIDTNSDGEIQISEVQIVYDLNIQNSAINYLEWLVYFNNLRRLDCAENFFSSIDLSQLLNLDIVYVNSNPNLVSINMKNGKLIFPVPAIFPAPPGQQGVDFQNCPNLNYICLEDQFIDELQTYITNYNITNILNYNSYCSFANGGISYILEAVNKLDLNFNGCDSNDIFIPKLKYNVLNETTSNIFISGNSSNFNISFPSGQYTITPILENPNYFNVSPPSSNINFPTNASPFTQNFCISPNGVHNDLDIVFVPIGPARPGFDVIYKIIYKNNGTTSQSGTINLNFNDAILDFVSTSSAFSNQALNNLNWNFTNLAPFETRTIMVTLNVNSPTESPAVNSGNILNYTTTISGLTDETPLNNTISLGHIVVNSLDPNDKTCLEGTTVSSDMIGKYVHYIIRFENTGTFSAENIVVKDLIDTSKFDMNSLTPLNGSHEFRTKITNSNNVEFIFENINLPFDNANNDGYITFKIKTNSNLVSGDTFSNNASIYFDYNYPIITNTFTTTISALKNQDFSFQDYFTLSPNPAKDILSYSNNFNTEVFSINIYNSIGQIILTFTNPNNE